MKKTLYILLSFIFLSSIASAELLRRVSIIQFEEIDPTDVITESESISSNDNDTTIPTSAAVKDYADNQGFASSLIELSDVNTATVTAGKLLVADGTDFESMTLTGDCTLNGAGFISCDTGASSLTALSDVNSATTTAGKLLIADGTDFESMTLTGDCSMSGSGAISCPLGADNKCTGNDILQGDGDCVPTPTSGSGSAVILDIDDDSGNDSIDINEIATSGDTNGVITEPSPDKMLINFSNNWPSSDTADALSANGGNCSAGNASLGVDASGVSEGCFDVATQTELNAISLTSLSDVNSATTTAGKLLIADGTDFESMTLTGDCSLNGAGFISCTDNVGATSLIGLSDVNTATVTTGKLLIADGTDFESMTLSGDCTINGAGFITCTKSSGVDISTISGSQTLTNKTINADNNTISNIDTGEVKASTLVIEGEGISSNDNDTTLPTSAAVKDYVDTQDATQDECSEITNCVTGAATSLTGLSDVNTATITAGKILVADGTDFESMTLTGDCTLNGAGFITCTDNVGATSLTGLSDVNTATVIAGKILVADGTDFESVTLIGDASLSSSGTLTITAASLTTSGIAELATSTEIDTGTDTDRVMSVDDFQASKRNLRWLVFNLVEAATDTAAATNIAGDFVSPIAGVIQQSDTTPFYLYATNSTAGTTGTMVVDVSIGGTSIMTTNKLDFDTTEKTTTTAATPPDLTTTALAVGDIITIDIDTIHTTAAKGLTVYIGVLEN